MFRTGAILIVSAAIAGCQASASLDPETGRSRADTAQRQTQRAAFAASAQFPRDAQASNDLRVGAVVNQRTNSIKLLNFSDQPIRNATVWVNGSFATQVENLPPNGSIEIPRGNLYDATGRSLANQATSASRIQLQWNDNLYNVQGPIRE